MKLISFHYLETNQFQIKIQTTRSTCPSATKEPFQPEYFELCGTNATMFISTQHTAASICVSITKWKADKTRLNAKRIKEAPDSCRKTECRWQSSRVPLPFTPFHSFESVFCARDIFTMQKSQDQCSYVTERVRVVQYTQIHIFYVLA